MVIVTHESYDSFLVETGKQKGLESLSEYREWRRRCDVERRVVPDGGTRNGKRPHADCRETERRTGGTSRRHSVHRRHVGGILRCSSAAALTYICMQTAVTEIRRSRNTRSAYIRTFRFPFQLNRFYHKVYRQHGSLVFAQLKLHHYTSSTLWCIYIWSTWQNIFCIW